MDPIKRIDKYTIEIDGQQIRATYSQEAMLRLFSPEQRAMFLRTMSANERGEQG